MMQLLFTAYLLLTFTLKHRPYPQLNPEWSPVLYLSAMEKWVDKILKPYVNAKPDDVTLFLILDEYICQMMELIVNKIKI